MYLRRGFGLLEAIVAIAILAGVGVSIFAWVQQNLDATYRMREINRQIVARRLVLDWSNLINPSAVPEGEEKLGNLIVKWQSTPETIITQQAGYPSGSGLFDLQRFNLILSVYQSENNQEWFQLNRTAVGYRLARKNFGIFDLK